MKEHEITLKIALVDLKTAKFLLQEEELLSSAIYHVQQSIEKSLKAYLLHKQHPHPKTHDLFLLLDECAQYENGFYSFLELARTVKPFATKGRYADDYFVPEYAFVNESIINAEKLFNFVIEKIKK